MAHIYPDFKTKKAFKEAVKSGQKITVFNPSGMFPIRPYTEIVEAPANYHRWYAQVKHDKGIVIQVVG